MFHEWTEAALRTAAEGGPRVFVALAFATLLSEDLTCIAAGLLVAQGALTFAPATVACYAGILSGDMLLVLIGRTLGRKSLETAPLRWWARPALVARAEHWFERRGPVLIFASRFMPGTRVPAYFAAGALRAPMTKFFGWFALACAIWTPLLVGGTVFFGEAALHLFASWASVAPALLIGGIAAWFAAKAVVNLGTWRGRRLALGRWRRLTRWQFWPTWLLQAPLLPYLLWLGLRQRSVAWFTLVNPGLPTRTIPAIPGAGQFATSIPAQTPKVEFELTYRRSPGEAHGRIRTVVERQPHVLLGDGKHTLEELILADDEIVTVASHLIVQLEERLDEIPVADARLNLRQLGALNHSTRFVAASSLLTPAIEAHLAEAHRMPAEFCLGRIRLSATDAAALHRGEFEVIGLEGVESGPLSLRLGEPSIWSAWAEILRHWKQAAEIATQQRKRRARPR